MCIYVKTELYGDCPTLPALMGVFLFILPLGYEMQSSEINFKWSSVNCFKLISGGIAVFCM